MSKKYISFSLFGDSKLYNQGLIENIQLAKTFYPGWIVRVYVAANTPSLSVLQRMDCEIKIMPATNSVIRREVTKDDDWRFSPELSAMFWRYFVIDELETDDVAIFRDCDSRLNQRDVDITEKWLKADKIICRIFEHEAQRIAFWQGGMWGIRGNSLRGISSSIKEWIDCYHSFNHPYIFIDLLYSTNVLEPILSDKTMTFGVGGEPLPECKDEDKIGAVINGEWRNIKYVEIV